MQVMDQCCAVIVIKEEKILLGLRTDGQGYSMAGGKIEMGESNDEAAKRELKEEFNLKGKKLKYLGTISSYAYVRGTYQKVRPSVYLCKQFEGTIKPQKEEMQHLKWMGKEEILKHKLFPPTQVILDTFDEILFKK